MRTVKWPEYYAEWARRVGSDINAWDVDYLIRKYGFLRTHEVLDDLMISYMVDQHASVADDG